MVILDSRGGVLQYYKECVSDAEECCDADVDPDAENEGIRFWYIV